MDKLIIGDPASIEARDKDRAEAWLKEFESKFRQKVCEEHCCQDDHCEGPDAVELFHKGIVWACHRRNESCDSCGQDMDIDMPHTDFKGNTIGWIMSDERKPFDPESVAP